MAKPTRWTWSVDHFHDGTLYRAGSPVPDFGAQALESLQRVGVIVAAVETIAAVVPKLREPKPAAPSRTLPPDPTEANDHGN